MKLADQIHEERAAFFTFYRFRPDCVYLGHKQAAELEEVIANALKFGYVMQAPQPTPTFMGLRVYKVDSPSHLGFGLDRPSPCG